MVSATLGALAGAHVARADDGTCCPIVELRQYVLKPGRRDDLIALFDREFIESQEATGMRIIGQFRDLADADRFVWLRGFADMPSRAKALESFYTSPVWRTHRDAANDTMVDVGNVLLLRPLSPASGLALGRRPESEGARGIVEITVDAFEEKQPVEAIERFNRELEDAGTKALAAFVTEYSPNNFPRLPVRENENVLVRVATFETADAYRAHSAARPSRLDGKLSTHRQILTLAPTTRSLLHG